MNFLKHAIRKILLGHKSTSNDYVNYLRKKGASIGEGVIIYSPNHTYIDEMFPFMLTIGNNVNITQGVHILNHDFSWSVIKAKYGTIIGGLVKVFIGNNVFIWLNSIILMNTEVGDNVIIGSGSVVHGKIPANSVVAGSPAKVICTIEEFYDKRKKRQYDEAASVVIAYRNKFGVNPPKEALPAYFFLFEQRTENISPVFLQRMKLGGNLSETMNSFMNSSPMFESYEAFLNSIR